MRELRKEFADLRKEFADLRRDMNTGLSDMRKEAREDRLQIAADIKLLTGKVYEIMGQK
jgi:ribosomal protein L29